MGDIIHAIIFNWHQTSNGSFWDIFIVGRLSYLCTDEKPRVVKSIIQYDKDLARVFFKEDDYIHEVRNINQITYNGHVDKGREAASKSGNHSTGL